MIDKWTGTNTYDMGIDAPRKAYHEHKSWETLLRQYGSEHYRGLVQPIEIYRAKGCLKPWALCEISQHAIRNMDKELNIQDIIKIKHYAECLIADYYESHVEVKE